MSVSELLFALLLVCLVAGVAVTAYTVAAINRRAETQGTELAQLRAQLAMGGQVQESATGELRERLNQTHSMLEAMRSAFASRQQVEDEARHTLRRLEAVIAGSPSRGAAGENILEEAFRHLPPNMVKRNVWVGGKVVEFALQLPGGKQLPIDSKWTSSAALEELALPDLTAARRTHLAATIEKEVEKRIKEVSQYIDPATTAPFALAAVPDAAYAVCRTVFAEAHRRHVMVVAYSMTLPYLLLLYQLHLQFARSVDMDNLQASLMEIDRQLDALDSSLENKLQRAVTMLGNAYQDGKQVTARIRASVHGAQAAGQLETASVPSRLEEQRTLDGAPVPDPGEQTLHLAVGGRR